VVYQGTARGDVYLLLFDVNALPPPDGQASSAVGVSRVPASQLFGNAPATSVGPFSASFVFTQVPSNHTYQIRAFIDAAHSFEPFFDYAISPRAGDVAGGYGQIGANGVAQLLPIAVAPAQTVSGISVPLFQPVPYDPPACEIVGGSPTFNATIDQPVAMTLKIHPLPAVGITHAHFGLELDRDANGNARSSFADGIVDVFPRVVLQQIADDKGKPMTGVVIPTRTLPQAVLPALENLPNGAAPLARDQVTVLIEPVAVNASTQQPIGPPLPGTYRVVVIEKNGQVWQLPNSLGATDSTQAQLVTFVQPPSVPAGGISGHVVFNGGASVKSGNIIVQAYSADPNNPPPPIGAALPVRVTEVLAAQVTPTATGFTAPYTISDLPDGTYVVQALDDIDGNFAPVDILETPTRADLTGGVVNQLLQLKPITVAGSVVSGPDAILGRQVNADPPAFAIDPLGGPASMPADSVAPVRFGLEAQAFDFPMGAAATPAFTVALVRDANGATVDADGDGLPDIWPRVFLVRLDPNDPTGLTQFHDPSGKTLTQVIPAAVDPTPFLPALLATQGGAGTIAATKVTVIARPTLVDATNPDAKTRGNLQPGSYKIVVINETGQLWQIPNSAGSLALDPAVICAADATACAAGTVQTQSQSQAFTVTLPQRQLVANAIAGALTVSGIPSFAGAYVFAYSAENPPPPAGTGLPVSGDFHSAAEFANGSVQFKLLDLPLDSYIVTAVVDTRGDFALSPRLFAAAPGEGTVLAQHGGLVTLTDQAPVAAGIGITATAATAVPARPSFVLLNGSATATTDLVNPVSSSPGSLKIRAQKVLTSQVVLQPEPDAPAFLVQYVGCDGNGQPIDADHDGIPDLYPKVLVPRLLASDPTGLTVDPNTTIIPSPVDPTTFAAALGSCNSRTIVPTTDLPVILEPVAIHFVGGAPAQEPIPVGRYGVVVEQLTGQVWRVPNELQPASVDPRSTAADDLSSQGVGISITP
jgi:uncharacterized protein (DUF2141 family)